VAASPVLALLLAAPRLLYPVEAPPQVTATVGTYRIGHHHAGLDLGTDGREGLRAVAALDGEIVRIQRSHVGYGRAVYIRHADGLTTVYGHLDRFSPALEAIARAEEARVKKYALEKTLEPPLPVKQGDFLGHVGTSGTDLIHLHFELRSNNVPVNPLTNGLVLPDTQAPVIARVLLVPRDAGAQIDGLHAPREIVLGAEAAPPRPTVSGRVGVLVEVTDHIDGSPRDLEPAQLEFGVDGTVRHRVSYERVSYGQKSATELDYLAERKADGTGRFHRLWREGPDLLVFPGPVGRDLGDLSPGEHRLRFAARDAAGNETNRELLIQSESFRAPCAPTAADAPLAPGPEVPLTGTRWTEATLVVPLPGACAVDFVWWLEASSAGVAVLPATRWTRVPEGPALAVDLNPEQDTTLVLETRGGGGPRHPRPVRGPLAARRRRGHGARRPRPADRGQGRPLRPLPDGRERGGRPRKRRAAPRGPDGGLPADLATRAGREHPAARPPGRRLDSGARPLLSRGRPDLARRRQGHRRAARARGRARARGAGGPDARRDAAEHRRGGLDAAPRGRPARRAAHGRGRRRRPRHPSRRGRRRPRPSRVLPRLRAGRLAPLGCAEARRPRGLAPRAGRGRE
jgi:hypothetical protein